MFECCIIGLGHVGLPLALLAVKAEMSCCLVDIRPDRRRTALENVSCSRSVVRQEPLPASYYFICVETDIREEQADLGPLYAAVDSVCRLDCHGTVVLVSTVPVGTSRAVEALLRKSNPGWNVVYSPERFDPSNPAEEFTRNVRYVGGADASVVDALKDVFRRLGVRDIRDAIPEALELAKISENAFRLVNIAFAQEVAVACSRHELDFHLVAEIANSHPRVNMLDAGIGVGGHCLPVDPFFLGEAMGPILSALKFNAEYIDTISAHVRRIVAAEGASSVLFVGVSYKANSSDCRNSAAIKIAKGVKELGVVVEWYDPLVTEAIIGLRRVESLQRSAADLAFVLVEHDAIKAQMAELLKVVPRVLFRNEVFPWGPLSSRV